MTVLNKYAILGVFLNKKCKLSLINVYLVYLMGVSETILSFSKHLNLWKWKSGPRIAWICLKTQAWTGERY